MASICINKAVLPVKVHEYYAMADAVIQCCDTDSVLPPLDQGTVRKINSSNALVENRMRIYRNQLQKEKDEAKTRFLGKRQDFLRTSFILQERKRLVFRKKSRKTTSEKNKKRSMNEESAPLAHSPSKEDLKSHENGSRTTRENSINVDSISPLRPPFFLPPLHKNIMIDLKDAKERKEKQDMYCKLNALKVEDLPSCRYLRIAGRARVWLDLKSDEDGWLMRPQNN